MSGLRARVSMAPVVNTFRLYIGLKLHFNDSAYLWKPDMVSRHINLQTLQKRKDMPYFVRLTNKYSNAEEVRNFMISCFLHNPKSWIGEMFEMEDEHNSRMKRVSTLTARWLVETNELADYLHIKSLCLRDILISRDMKKPIIVSKAKQIGVSLETLSLLDRAFQFSKQETNDPIWVEEGLRLKKYSHFLNLDKQAYTSQLDMLVKKNEAQGIDNLGAL